MARILIVEDEEGIRGLLQVILAEAGHVVDEACNGAEGLQRYTAAPADLVILDMHMPIMDGRQFILALRQRFSDPTILAISGEPELLAHARALHVQGTLPKPFAVPDLLAAVQGLLRPCEA
jgi:DNA-binding response OmpR family regulator